MAPWAPFSLSSWLGTGKRTAADRLIRAMRVQFFLPCFGSDNFQAARAVRTVVKNRGF